MSQHLKKKSIFARQNVSGGVPSSVAWSKLKFADFRAKYCGFFIQNKNLKQCKNVKKKETTNPESGIETAAGVLVVLLSLLLGRVLLC